MTCATAEWTPSSLRLSSAASNRHPPEEGRQLHVDCTVAHVLASDLRDLVLYNLPEKRKVGGSTPPLPTLPVAQLPSSTPSYRLDYGCPRLTSHGPRAGSVTSGRAPVSRADPASAGCFLGLFGVGRIRAAGDDVLLRDLVAGALVG